MRDAHGYTALHWAGIRGHWRIFSELLAAGAPVDAIGGDGGTPLHWACHHEHPDMIAKLLEAGASVDTSNRWGRTPLHVAARRGCRQVAALLLDHGADVNAVTKEGWTPLHVAYRSDHAQTIELLLARGADPQRTDTAGSTAAESARKRSGPITVSREALSALQGLYDLGDGAIVKIWLEDNQLHLREYAPDLLDPIAPDQFQCRQEPWTVRFIRDDSGAVTAVELDYLRRTVRATRRPHPSLRRVAGV